MPAIVWKGYVSFGLVSFPVRLYSAAWPEAVHFHMLHRKDLSRVKEVWYCSEEDKPIQRSDMVKGYEMKKGEYIVVEDEELKKLAPPTATTMDILQFVAEDEVDPVQFERSSYLAADEKVGKAMPKTTTTKRWSQKVTETSDALDLEDNIFASTSARRIALSLKHSAEQSTRRKSSPFQSAMSMLNFYINRAGRNLPQKQKHILANAKTELRRLFGKIKAAGHVNPS